MAKVEISGNFADILVILGNQYPTPAEAIKEYVSNAIDAYLASNMDGLCRVRFEIHRKSIIIKYNAPGMTEKEFKNCLQSVADSIKKKLDIDQIGRLGIGLWNFLQYANQAVFLSRGLNSPETIKVALKRGDGNADIVKASKKEVLDEPGMVITVLGRRSSRPREEQGPGSRPNPRQKR